MSNVPVGGGSGANSSSSATSQPFVKLFMDFNSLAALRSDEEVEGLPRATRDHMFEVLVPVSWVVEQAIHYIIVRRPEDEQ